MILQPLICFDNFYNDPDAVRDYALSLDYSECGVFPGVRTEALHKFDKEFFYRSCYKFLSLFLDLDFEKVEWQILSQFQKIYRYSEDKSSPSNTGWVHADSDFMSAVVYLNHNPNPDSGTSLYSSTKDVIIDMSPTDELRNSFFQNKLVTPSSYEEELLKNNSFFEKTVEIKNVYNRIIMYDSNQYHAQDNYWMDNEDFRLTQVFFLQKLQAKNVPSERCKMHGI